MLPHLSRDGDKFIIYNNQIQFITFFFFFILMAAFFGGGKGVGGCSRQGLQSVEYHRGHIVLYIYICM